MSFKYQSHGLRTFGNSNLHLDVLLTESYGKYLKVHAEACQHEDLLEVPAKFRFLMHKNLRGLVMCIPNTPFGQFP